MSAEEYLILGAATADSITFIKKSSRAEEQEETSRHRRKRYDVEEEERKKKQSLLRRFPSFQSALRPNFRKITTSFRKLSCLKRNDDEEIPILEIPNRHKSIDIGANGKTFATCELVMELIKQGFPEHQLSIWMCLIEAESSMRTEVVGGPDADGSFDYGLFQINDRYWCNTGDRPGKGCNVTCSDLLTANITLASQCAKKIHKQQGFGAWLGWRQKCRGKKQDVYC